jgi:hypothetical protein
MGNLVGFLKQAAMTTAPRPSKPAPAR